MTPGNVCMFDSSGTRRNIPEGESRAGFPRRRETRPSAVTCQLESRTAVCDAWEQRQQRRCLPMDADALLLAARAARRARAYDEAQRALEKYQQVRGLDDAGSLEELLLSAERDVEQVVDACRQYVERGHPDTPLILEALTRGYLR